MKKPKPFFEQRRERRGILRTGLAAVTGGALTGALSGCDAVSSNPAAVNIMKAGEHLSYEVHRIIGRKAMAQEFKPSDVSKDFRGNGTLMPSGKAYAELLANRFDAWRLKVDGLVGKPLEFSLAQLQAMPSRTQITRHDCVEGWSAIGQWKGVRLSHLLSMAGVREGGKFVVFHCMDLMQPGNEATAYYESVDMDDAFHEQTILAWELNGQPLPVKNGAPLRARIERQLGYKNPKYLHRVEVVSTLQGIAGGNGGYWEDQGYNWYGGI